MAETETAWFRGEGGHVWKMDLPLSEDHQQQLTKGYLTRVNEDGSTWQEPTEPGQDPAPATEDPPDKTALKAEWVGWAVRNRSLTPDDAEAMTKHDLMALTDKPGGDSG